MNRETLPKGYGENYVRCLVRDPECIFGYWEVITQIPKTTKLALKVNNLTKNLWQLIEVTDEIGNWYIKAEPDTKYLLEIGILKSNGDFESVASSNIVVTPRRIPVKITYKEGLR